MPGTLVLVLHAHLPYVRHPEHEWSLEETWLYEAVADCYLPLLDVLDRLTVERVPFRLTVSLSPTLVAMWNDELLRQRCARYLEARCELGQRELRRTATSSNLAALARFHAERFELVRTWYEVRFKRDLTAAFARLERAGTLELVTTAATHAFLPALEAPGSIRAQIAIGLESHQRIFGRKPDGFWLPECGISSEVERELTSAGARYTFLDTHGLTDATPRPRFGCYAPLLTEAGLVVLGRDPAASEQVWSAEVGYPGDPAYREFHRDIGFELSPETIGVALRPAGRAGFTGFKYHRVTGRPEKELYDPAVAFAKAQEHARHFARERLAHAEALERQMQQAPVIVAPYDAELFGHWWFEGPVFLEAVIREIAATGLRLRTASDLLREQPVLQVGTPAASSWGQGGDARTWLNAHTAWTVAESNRAGAEMIALATSHAADDRARHVLQQAARELLLAQASDWQFMITNRTFADYASRRIREHLAAFEGLARAVRDGLETPDVLGKRRQMMPLFESLNEKAFAEV